MHLRPAGETRIFQEGQGALLRPLPPSHHPKWFGLFLHEHKSEAKSLHAELAKSDNHWMIIPAVVFGLTALLFGGYVAYFHGRIKPGVTVGSVSLSGKTESEARAALQKQTSLYTVNFNTVSRVPLKANQLGVSFDINKTLDDAMKAGSLNPASHHQVYFKVSVDDKTLQKYLDSVNKVSQVPVNAKLDISTDGQVIVVSQQRGSSHGISPAVAKATIISSARQGRPLKLEPTVFDSLPGITTEYASKAKAVADKIIVTPVSLSVQGHEQTTTPAQVASWLTVTPQEDQSRIDVKVDNVKVSAYLDSIAKSYVTPPRAKVITKGEDGTTKVLSEGAPGTDITGKAEVAAELAISLNQQKPYSKALPVAYADPQTITAGDYDKWLDVDLTNHRMYAYEHGTVVKQFLISAGAPATPTVKGQFTIKSKFRRQDMRGFNADGSKYFQPNVEYISYFYQDYAIHGNYWRPVSVFGHTNLSHGCVGVVNADAKWVYDWAPIGTTVITHD